MRIITMCMKKLFLSIAILSCCHSVSAASVCDNSQLIIHNQTDSEILVNQVKSQTYFPESYSEFDKFGKLYGIHPAKKLKPHSATMITAHSNTGSRGDILQNIVLKGSQGVVDVDISFSSTFWGYGSCFPVANGISQKYRYHAVSIPGIPATIEIYVR